MIENLSLKERKILYELDTNSSQSYHEIARKVGLSKDAIIYRIKKLQETGIIKQFHTVIDVGKLGLTSFRLYLKFQDISPQKQDEIINFLKEQKIVTWLVSIDGEYDLGMWILAESIKEVNTLWKELMSKFRDFIEKKWLTIFTKVSYFPRTYILEQKKNREELIFITEPEKAKLDETDIKLLRLLAPNSRISVLELSEKLKITPKTVTARINQLEKKKVIIGYRTMFDLEKIGYQYFKVHFNLHNLNGIKEKEFMNYIKQHPNVTYNNEVLGGDDIEIEIQIQTIRELREFLEQTKKQFSDIIRSYSHMTFYKEHKYLFFPL